MGRQNGMGRILRQDTAEEGSAGSCQATGAWRNRRESSGFTVHHSVENTGRIVGVLPVQGNRRGRIIRRCRVPGQALQWSAKEVRTPAVVARDDGHE